MDNRQGADGKALERVNLMLTRDDSAWLDTLANQIRENTGAKVSRSEIVRAALSTMAELHRLEPMFPAWLMPLHTCKTERELAVAGILAIRSAARP
jgi:hypothetical protein